jgi:hypothetical protein
MSAELVVYTAIFAGRDTLEEPTVVTPDCRYVCFTDEPVRSDVWEIIPRPRYPDPRRQARLHKLLPDRLFQARYSLWINGFFRINVNVRDVIAQCLVDADVATFRHPDRDCIFDELDICVALGLDDPDRMRRQVEGYRLAGYPAHAGLGATGVLLRRHTPAVIELSEMWWGEVARGSIRDQLSFNYCLWKLGVPWGIIPGHVQRSPEFQLMGHRPTSRPAPGP